MRILLLTDRIPPENRGGAGIVVWRLAKVLHQMGHDVHVCAATEKATFEEVRDGIPTYHLHSRYRKRWRAWVSLYNPQTAKPLRALYERLQPDVINAHNIHEHLSYYCLSLAHQMQIPAVFSSHDVMLFAYHKISYFIDRTYCGVRDPAAYRLPKFFNLRQMRFRYNPLRNWVIRWIMVRHVALRTTPSQALADAHHANGLPTFQVVHNGLDPALIEASESAIAGLRQRLNLEGKKVILFAGRLSGGKGMYQLLAALDLLVREVPQAILLVLSATPITEQIRDTQYAHLRDDHIVSGGWLSGESLAAAYHVADVLVTPSVTLDPFPTVNLEAMAARRPVVATCFGGSPEAVADGETGYVANPFDAQNFATRLGQLLTDDVLRERMGQAGYERLCKHYTMDAQAQAMLALFQQAIATSASS